MPCFEFLMDMIQERVRGKERGWLAFSEADDFLQNSVMKHGNIVYHHQTSRFTSSKLLN